MDNKLAHILEPLEGHEILMLDGVARRLKQSDGEGWAVGEMLERALNIIVAKQEQEPEYHGEGTA